MDKKKIDKLLKVADEQEKIRLTVFYNAAITSFKKYNSDPTTAKANNWKRAEKELEEQITALTEKYFKSEARLSNILAVVKHVKALGYRLEKSTAYKHVNDGRLRADKDGTYTLATVEKYAATLRRIGGAADAKVQKHQSARAAAEAQKTQAQADYWELRTKIMSGQYVEKGEFERALAQRAAVFKNDLESKERTRAPAIINLVAGNPDKIPDLIEFMLDGDAELLNRYDSDQEFVVPAPVPAALLVKEEQKTDDEDDEE